MVCEEQTGIIKITDLKVYKRHSRKEKSDKSDLILVLQLKLLYKMGLFISKLSQLFETFGQGQPSRILMLGLDAAGMDFLYLAQILNISLFVIFIISMLRMHPSILK